SLDLVAQRDRAAVVGQLLTGMRDHGFLPRAVASPGAAVGLEVPGIDAAAGEVAGDGEDVLLPREAQGRGEAGLYWGRRRASGEEQNSRRKRFHVYPTLFPCSGPATDVHIHRD